METVINTGAGDAFVVRRDQPLTLCVVCYSTVIPESRQRLQRNEGSDRQAAPREDRHRRVIRHR